ncbi:hypothetical protein FA13DRAFT_1269591 [Coprinellus micaceus]|uniref:Uncharacterized protein n=1 Tax=Coprinellus micaceus TaxID=71717 RepID=A0A4Y7STC8_COPMI|nr:hypothetical protein FA13DRAFT_1269591 [Coprinellus micaceus]
MASNAMPVPAPVERVLFSDDTVRTPTLGMNGRKKGPLNGSVPMNFGETVYALTVCSHPPLQVGRWLEEPILQVRSQGGPSKPCQGSWTGSNRQKYYRGHQLEQSWWRVELRSLSLAEVSSGLTRRTIRQRTNSAHCLCERATAVMLALLHWT